MVNYKDGACLSFSCLVGYKKLFLNALKFELRFKIWEYVSVWFMVSESTSWAYHISIVGILGISEILILYSVLLIGTRFYHRGKKYGCSKWLKRTLGFYKWDLAKLLLITLIFP